MKKTFLLSSFVIMFAISLQAQTFKRLINKATGDTSSKSSVNKIFNAASAYKKDTLSNITIISGLKEALRVGTERGTQKLSAVDGFFEDAAVKILVPEEAKKVESTLRSLGMSSLVDKAILSMNRAAEEAAKGSGAIFMNAVEQMTITDAVNILKGGDFAATNYFKGKTTTQLTESFRPIIDKALKDANATKYWGDVTAAYNRFSTTKVNTDLTAYVTQKAMDGIFYQVGLEEQKIRKDPVSRTTELLKKVFSSQLAQGG